MVVAIADLGTCFSTASVDTALRFQMASLPYRAPEVRQPAASSHNIPIGQCEHFGLLQF